MSRGAKEKSVYKLRVNRWAHGVEASNLSIMQAQQIAASAEIAFKLMLWVRDGTMDRFLPSRPDRAIWESLYYDHRAITHAVGDAFGLDLGGGAECQNTLDLSRAVSRRIEPVRNEFDRYLRRDIARLGYLQWWQRNFRMFNYTYKKHLLDVRSTIQGKVVADGPEDFEQVLRDSPGVYFYLRIVLPAALIHQKTPAQLLRRTRRGRASDVEALVRVDDRSDHFELIERWQNVEDGETRRTRQQLIRHWQDQGLNNGQFSRKQMKCYLGGLIAALFGSVGSYLNLADKKMHPANVTAEQIRDLFNRVAQDRVGRTEGVVDRDISNMQAESWARKVRQNRKRWEKMLPMFDGQKSG